MGEVNYHKIIYVIILCVITILISIFDNDILLLYYRFKYPSPIIWNNMEICFDRAMIYKKEQNKITLSYPNSLPKGSIAIGKMIVNDFSEIDVALNKMNYIVLGKHRALLNGYESYFIKCRKKPQDADILLTIFIASIDIAINYIGPEKNYIYFENIINKIKFNSEFRGHLT